MCLLTITRPTSDALHQERKTSFVTFCYATLLALIRSVSQRSPTFFDISKHFVRRFRRHRRHSDNDSAVSSCQLRRRTTLVDTIYRVSFKRYSVWFFFFFKRTCGIETSEFEAIILCITCDGVVCEARIAGERRRSTGDHRWRGHRYSCWFCPVSNETHLYFVARQEGSGTELARYERFADMYQDSILHEKSTRHRELDFSIDVKSMSSELRRIIRDHSDELLIRMFDRQIIKSVSYIHMCFFIYVFMSSNRDTGEFQ